MHAGSTLLLHHRTRHPSREDFLAFEVFLSRSSVHSHPCPSYDLSATITLQLSAGANLSSSMVQAHDRDPSGLRLHWMDADWWNKTMNHSKAERMSHKPWNSTEAPAKILAIRFHAIGDVAITLPCSASLRRKFPGARFGFLTGTDSMGLPQASGLFDEVMTVPVSSPRHRKLQSAFQVGLKMRQGRFVGVFELERKWVSRIIRMTGAPRAGDEFDRFSRHPAGV